MENHDTRKLISTEAGGEGEPPIKGLTEEVTPNLYDICIKPEDWKINCSIAECTIEVSGIHESCICHVYPDDDMMMNKSKNRSEVSRLLKAIYNDEKLIVNIENGKIKCKFIGNCPTESIYLQLEELPFFDVPASRLGIQ